MRMRSCGLLQGRFASMQNVLATADYQWGIWWQIGQRLSQMNMSFAPITQKLAHSACRQVCWQEQSMINELTLLFMKRR